MDEFQPSLRDWSCWDPHPALRAGLFSARAVQISGLIDSVVLIWLEELVPRPIMWKSGWGGSSKRSAVPSEGWVITEAKGAAPTALGIIIHRCPSPIGLG